MLDGWVFVAYSMLAQLAIRLSREVRRNLFQDPGTIISQEEGDSMMNTKQPGHIKRFLGIVVTTAIVALTSFTDAQGNAANQRTGTFAFGTALGVQVDTPDSTAFALGLYGDYYLTHAFSIGPLIQLGFTSDLFQFAPTAQAKYTLDLADMPQLKPHVQAGIGIIHADLDRRGMREEKDTSFLIPLGIGAEYKLTDSVSLDNTFLFNFTNLGVRDEKFFFAWLIGLKF